MKKIELATLSNGTASKVDLGSDIQGRAHIGFDFTKRIIRSIFFKREKTLIFYSYVDTYP